MALTDIDFQEGEGQDFIVELALGVLGTPADILTESAESQYPVLEAPLVTGGGGDEIFILND
jgi:hypothetical protein